MTKGWKIIFCCIGTLLLLAAVFVWWLVIQLSNLMPSTLSETVSLTRAGRVVCITDPSFKDTTMEYFAVSNAVVAKPVRFGGYDSDESLIHTETWSKDGTLFAVRSEIWAFGTGVTYGPFFTAAYDFKSQRVYNEGPVRVVSKQIRKLMLARGGELPVKSTKWRDLSADQERFYTD